MTLDTGLSILIYSSAGSAPEGDRHPTRVERPHFSFPFQRGPSGKVEVVEQGTTEHVLSCVDVIARYPTGFREDRPEFGWAWPEFRTAPISTEDLAAALHEFEPRGRYRLREYADSADPTIRHIDVEVEA